VSDDGYFPMLRLPGLQIDILRAPMDEPQPTLLGDGQDLDTLLDLAIDGATHKQDLVALRECLLDWAARATAALDTFR
jgi:hypothetical protein